MKKNLQLQMKIKTRIVLLYLKQIISLKTVYFISKSVIIIAAPDQINFVTIISAQKYFGKANSSKSASGQVPSCLQRLDNHDQHHENTKS